MDILRYFLQDGDTPIHLALRYGHVEVIEELISSRADANVVDKVSVNRIYTKQPSCKKRCGPCKKRQHEKSYEIKGGGPEVAVMVG